MLSESDWTLINAYADGELPADRAAEIARRLRSEPALAEALAEVRSTKSRLAAMRPAQAADRRVPTLRVPTLGAPTLRAPSLRASRRLAAAACIALPLAIAAAYPALWRSPDWTEAAAEFHRSLSENTYVLPDRVALPVISTARIGDVQVFDLSSSRLYLVDVQSSRGSGRDVVAMHYRGRNGCRLTAVAVEALAGDPAELPVRHEGLGARWTVGPIHFYLLASGMDDARFRAIASYARAESERLNRDARLRLAMQDATDHARPCT
jgi:hypothetical protein